MDKNKRPKGQRPGSIRVADRDYDQDHIARIDHVVRLRQAGDTRVNALTAAGFSGAYTDLFRSPVYLDRLRLWTGRTEAEYLDQRADIWGETLALARNPDIHGRERVAAYRLLGQWAGMDSGPPALPEGGQSDTLPPKSVQSRQVDALITEFEVIDSASMGPKA